MRVLILAAILAIGLAACGHRTALKLPQEKGKPAAAAPELLENERP
jgi:predicted small lipoprotein YifL